MNTVAQVVGLVLLSMLAGIGLMTSLMLAGVLNVQFG